MRKEWMFFLLIMLLIWIAPAHAQQTSLFTVFGEVFLSDGVTCAPDGTIVTVANLNTGTSLSKTVDAAEPGKYIVVFVDFNQSRAAAVGDQIEITAESPEGQLLASSDPYTVTAEDITARRVIIMLNRIVADIASAQGEGIPDGYVDGFDLYTMGAHWHESSSDIVADIASAQGEGISDDYVDGFDLYTMGAHWHEGVTPSADTITAITPEGSNDGAILAVDFVYEDNSGADTIENTINIVVGKNFYAHIVAQDVVNLATYNVVINFDPSILTYIGADSGSQLSRLNILESEGGKMLGLIIDDSKGKNGKLELTNTLKGKENPPSGNGLLAIITFTGQSAGETTISFGTGVKDNYLISIEGIADTSFISNGQLLSGVVNQTNWGDVSGDGYVTAYDAALVLQYIVGLTDFEITQQQVADVTDDGNVTALDAALILQYTVFLITQFPVETKTAAPLLATQSEQDALKKAIAQLEAIAINREQKKVLKQLKHLVFQKSLPKRTALLQNFPNPFNPETWIPFQLAEDSEVTIRIFAINGTLVRTLQLGFQPAGYYINRNKAAYWNGKNEAGGKASSGLYFYKIQAGNLVATRKMILVK